MHVKREIRLRTLQEIHEFVRLADACDQDVNIGYDRVVIDAKSIVGVMGLDLGRRLTVSYFGENRDLESFIAAHPA